MKRALALLTLLLVASAPGAAAPIATRADIPPVVLLHLRHLEETYRVLDIVAPKVWPGWTTYRDTPFLLEYPNGLRVMVGHPNPPADEFEPVEGVQVEKMKVAIDRRKLLPIPLEAPLAAGGGPIGYGTTTTGQSVRVVHMQFRTVGNRTDSPNSTRSGRATDEQILIYIHELFHCFQFTRFAPARYGNLQFNADANYATWSEVEGLALDAAYAEKDSAQALERLKDFIVARQIKRRSMTEQQSGEESADDMREGTATYSMVRTLDTLRDVGFARGIAAEDDPDYGGFRDIEPMLKDYVDRLRASAKMTANPKGKCYDYGSFQSLLSERLFPGWQEAVTKGSFIDAEITKQLAMSDAERARVEQRLADRYHVSEIRTRVTAELEPRDAAWRTIRARRGRVYVIDMKAAGQYLDTVFPANGGFALGIGRLYPNGVDAVKFNDVELSRVTVPLETAQLYYVRIVDTAPKKGDHGYVLTGQKQPDGSYVNATVTTPLFTLKAPRLRVGESAGRIKLQVLSRVKGGSG
jgi:multidrug efflux pump subunit AcrA (membrane-fusion protein)